MYRHTFEQEKRAAFEKLPVRLSDPAPRQQGHRTAGAAVMSAFDFESGWMLSEYTAIPFQLL